LIRVQFIKFNVLLLSELIFSKKNIEWI